jgi:hypothetical protein
MGKILDCRLEIAESKVAGVPPEADQVSGNKSIAHRAWSIE